MVLLAGVVTYFAKVPITKYTAGEKTLSEISTIWNTTVPEPIASLGDTIASNLGIKDYLANHADDMREAATFQLTLKELAHMGCLAPLVVHPLCAGIQPSKMMNFSDIMATAFNLGLKYNSINGGVDITARICLWGGAFVMLSIWFVAPCCGSLSGLKIWFLGVLLMTAGALAGIGELLVEAWILLLTASLGAVALFAIGSGHSAGSPELRIAEKADPPAIEKAE